MTRALVLVLLLGGCAVFDRTPPGSPDQESCAREALRDPIVKDFIMKGAGSDTYLREHDEEIRAAKQDAAVRCLRGRGLVPAGGVERQKPF